MQSQIDTCGKFLKKYENELKEFPNFLNEALETNMAKSILSNANIKIMELTTSKKDEIFKSSEELFYRLGEALENFVKFKKSVVNNLNNDRTEMMIRASIMLKEDMKSLSKFINDAKLSEEFNKNILKRGITMKSDFCETLNLRNIVADAFPFVKKYEDKKNISNNTPKTKEQKDEKKSIVNQLFKNNENEKKKNISDKVAFNAGVFVKDLYDNKNKNTSTAFNTQPQNNSATQTQPIQSKILPMIDYSFKNMFNINDAMFNAIVANIYTSLTTKLAINGAPTLMSYIEYISQYLHNPVGSIQNLKNPDTFDIVFIDADPMMKMIPIVHVTPSNEAGKHSVSVEFRNRI